MTLIGEVNQYVQIEDLVVPHEYQYILIDHIGDTFEVLPGTVVTNGVRYAKLRNDSGIKLKDTYTLMAFIKNKVYTVYEL